MSINVQSLKLGDLLCQLPLPFQPRLSGWRQVSSHRERTIAALAAAKARGSASGNPKLAEPRAIANANHTAGALRKTTEWALAHHAESVDEQQ